MRLFFLGFKFWNLTCWCDLVSGPLVSCSGWGAVFLSTLPYRRSRCSVAQQNPIALTRVTRFVWFLSFHHCGDECTWGERPPHRQRPLVSFWVVVLCPAAPAVTGGRFAGLDVSDVTTLPHTSRSLTLLVSDANFGFSSTACLPVLDIPG